MNIITNNKIIQQGKILKNEDTQNQKGLNPEGTEEFNNLINL